MPKTKQRKVPSYQLHKPTKQALVTLDGRDIYLGQHDTPASHELYDQLIAEWLANSRRLPQEERDRVTVTELIAAFWRHAQGYYRKPDGTPTSLLDGYKLALRPLKHLYGSTPAVEFGPKRLVAVRQQMESAGLSRGTVNKMVNLSRGVFRWANAQELIPVHIHTALLSVQAHA